MSESKKKKGLVEILLTRYRGTFATIFLLPISVCYEAWLGVKRRITLLLNSAPKLHDQRLKKVQKQLQRWRDEGCQNHLTTGRSGWFTMSELVPAYKKSSQKIYLKKP